MIESEELSAEELRDLLRAAKLAVRYKEGVLTPMEMKELQSWIDKAQKHQIWFEALIEDKVSFAPKLEDFKDASRNSRDEFLAICHKLGIAPRVGKHRPIRKGVLTMGVVWSVAASLVLSVVGYHMLSQRNRYDVKNSPIAKVQEDLPPGGYRAILTLSDGKQVALDSARNVTTLAQQGGTTIETTVGGGLVYRMSNTKDLEVLHNTLTTRRGDTYKVLLPDGSAVWLNSESSLEYPTHFTGPKREVSLIGEAYFEIKNQSQHPFVVHTNRQEVMVLGTHFDVSAYEDEPAQTTTLLQGTVRVTVGELSRIISPGQQMKIKPSGTIQLKDDVDLEEIVAWKEHIFQWNETDLEVAMRQLGRWYDATIEYDHKNPPGITVSGYISRDLPVSKILTLFEKTHEVKFTILGKKIVVSTLNSSK